MMKRIVSISKRSRFPAPKCALFLVFIILSFVPEAIGQCDEWDLRGRWNIVQDDGYRVLMSLQQDGSKLSGIAEYSLERGAARGVGGKVSGSIVGEEFNIEIVWDRGGVGVYKGKLIPVPDTNKTSVKLLQGSATNNMNPGSSANWSFVEKIGCRSKTIQQPQPDGKTNLTPWPTLGCKQWDVSGAWSLIQDDGITVYMNLRQNGTKLIGSADYSNPLMVTGTAKGEIRDNAYIVKLTWTTGQSGEYSGKIDPTGKIAGNIFLGNRRGFGWSNLSPMKCLNGGTAN